MIVAVRMLCVRGTHGAISQRIIGRSVLLNLSEIFGDFSTDYHFLNPGWNPHKFALPCPRISLATGYSSEYPYPP